MRMFPHYLFGNYIVEIAKLFKYAFNNFHMNDQTKINPLQVYFGTPDSAFRYWYKKFNGQMLLPSLNFYGIDYRRRFDKECPNTHLEIEDKRTYNPKTREVAVSYPPMHFDVTYQFSLFNNNYRERDKMLHSIFMMFPRGSCSLRWYPDRKNNPDIFLFMPLSINEDFIDDTEVEGLDQTETRDIIKTTFNIVSSAVVPYDLTYYPAVASLYFDEEINEEYNRVGLIQINNQLGNSIDWHNIYTTGETLKSKGSSDYAINDYWHYTLESKGKIEIKTVL